MGLRVLARRAEARPGWPQALAALLLLVFAVQTTLVQTHIHSAPARDHAAGAALSQNSPAPLNPADDPATCPVCQDLAASGHYLTPAPIALALPVTFIVAQAVFAVRQLQRSAPAHGWQSRGPPSV